MNHLTFRRPSSVSRHVSFFTFHLRHRRQDHAEQQVCIQGDEGHY